MLRDDLPLQHRPTPTPLRRPRQTRAKVKVGAILQAADDLLESTPAAALAMRDVARRAGVKPATLYDYFPTKELLLRSLEDRAWERTAERARAALDQEVDGRLSEAIAAIVETAMREMIPAARKYGLSPESPFGYECRQALGAQFAALAAHALAKHGGEAVRAGDLCLALSIVTDAVALLTWSAARDNVASLEDGSYPREVGRLVARYLIRDAG
jgi:AcrR family transcriptional regulator